MKIVLFLFSMLFSLTIFAKEIQVDRLGYSLIIDCDKRIATRFEYTLVKDSGNLSRNNSFYFDRSLPIECRQLSVGSYKGENGVKYDRGHLVPANHLDSSYEMLVESNYMSNVLPQTRSLNRGAWKATENLVECYREFFTLKIIGGPFYDERKEVKFMSSHGISIPTHFYKIIYRNDGHAIAWLLPNRNKMLSSSLDEYRISISLLEEILNVNFGFSDFTRKSSTKTTAWELPKDCNFK